MHGFSLRPLACVVLPWVLCAGCFGNADPIVRVGGTITYQGQPLQGFVVTFQPEKGRPSVSGIDEQGRFDLAYTFREKGVLKGKHKVYLHYSPVDTRAAMLADRGRYDRRIREILQKYGAYDRTSFEVAITQPEDDLQIDLP